MALPTFDETGYELWKRIALRPSARHYLLVVASGMPDTIKAGLAQAKAHEVTRYNWRKSIDGFAEFEDRLWADPVLAANFLSMVYWPHALYYQAQVLTRSEPGNRSHAARFIIHTADPGLRPETPPKGPPDAPGTPGKSRLTELLSQVGERQKSEAVKEIDDEIDT